MFVASISVWVLGVVLSGSGEDGLGVDDELRERDGGFIDEGLVGSV